MADSYTSPLVTFFIVLDLCGAGGANSKRKPLNIERIRQSAHPWMETLDVFLLLVALMRIMFSITRSIHILKIIPISIFKMIREIILYGK